MLAKIFRIIMLPLQLFRIPKFTVFISTLILFVSCSQYDMDKTDRNFDYTIYETLKSENFLLDIPIEIMS